MVKYLRGAAVIFLALLILSFFSYKDSKDLQKHGYEWEEYDSSLAGRLHSINSLLLYTDSLSGFKERQNLNYVELLASVVRKRFYHGYSFYSYSDNWMATMAGKIIWSDLSAIVLPDDIMKHPMAACSQQAIVLMECFTRIGIDYRKVGFTGHFALEGKVKGNWYFFDTDMEPKFVNRRKSLSELINSQELLPSYANHIRPNFSSALLEPFYGEVNLAPAPRAAIFHKATFLLSKFLFLSAIIFVLYPLIKKLLFQTKVLEAKKKPAFEYTASV